MIKSEKKFDTGLRIFEVLKILINQDVSKNELIENIKSNSHLSNVYTPEAFIKYFNTIESLGFNIVKDKNVYKLKNALEEISLSRDEKKVLLSCIKYIRKIHNKKTEAHLKDFFARILKFFPYDYQKEISETLNCNTPSLNSHNNTLNSLESFIEDNQQVELTFIKANNTKETIVVELKDIIEKNGNIQLICYDTSKSRNKKILLNSIIAIQQLPKKALNVNPLNTVVFNLYGRLAKSYKLKQSEKLLNWEEGYITVSNSEEDKDTLIKRLLKYGENCKIIRPQNVVDDFISLTDDILKNLGEVS